MSRDKVEDYRGHQLVARPDGDCFRGAVWKAGKCLFTTAEESRDEVVTAMRTFVDSFYSDIAARRSEPPEVQEYVQAFQTILSTLSDGQLAMLKAHCRAANQTLTATQLAHAAGYKDYSAANLHYGRIGWAIRDHVPVTLPEGPDGKPIYTFAIADQATQGKDESQWQWKLKPAVATALAVLGLER